MAYQNLDPDKIVSTVHRLQQRIESRFPGSGLGNVCQELLDISQRAQHRSAAISRPILWLRVAIWVLIVMIVIGIALVFTFGILKLSFRDMAADRLEPVLNEVVLVGAGLFFLITLENRLKRRRALRAIHELRSLAHVIDMHQLTKDPERLLNPASFAEPFSPQLTMSRFQLRRYLDYCSEMLSLIGKVAALYVQRFDDPVALASVNEVESLTTGLSRKIWQKIMILHLPQTDRDGSNLTL